MKIKKNFDYLLQLFGLKKRERSIKAKMYEAAREKCEQYKKEAREATKMLRLEHEKQVA